MTLNEALFGRQPVSLYFYYFLRENKKWQHLMMINLWLLIHSLFGWLVADGWCWFVLREEYCWLVASGWFVLREKYCWLVPDKPSEQTANFSFPFRTTIMFMIIFIYLHALHSVINVMFLCMYMFCI
jgi:hypothetical protein